MTSIETSHQLIEKTIFIKDLDPVVILGFNDEHLNQLDSAFPSTKITARGNRIKILGPQDEVSAIEEIMSEMISIGRQTGNIRSQDVSTLLALADKTEGDGS